jgi:hypothetical protein
VVLCRLWFSRPLPADAIEYAADDVRYLLLAAHTLLQQLPAALMCISSLQQLLAQQGPEALRLQQQLLPGHSKLLNPLDMSSGCGAMGGGTSSSSPDVITLRGLTQMQFELKSEFTPANTGWFKSSFVVYLYEDHNPAAAAAASSSSPTAPAAAAAGSKLVDVDGSKAVLLAGSSSSSSSSSTAGAVSCDTAAKGGAVLSGSVGGSGSSNNNASALVDGVDEAVVNIAQLLPDRCAASC